MKRGLIGILKKIDILVLFFLLLVLNLIVGAEVRSPYRGGLESFIQYTPEYNFESGYRLRLANSFSTSNENINLRVVLASVSAYTDQINFPFERYSFVYPVSIAQLTLRTRVPLLFGIQGGDLSLGNVSANYSPYTVAIARLGSNMDRKGIALERFTLLNSQCNAFLVWIGDMDKPLYGFKMENRSPNNRLTGIIANYLSYGDDNGWWSQELVKSIEWNHLFPNGSLKCLYACLDRPEDFSEIKEIVYNNKLANGLGASLAWRDFSPEYRPQFRDQTVRFSTTTGALQSWNPLDRYYGRKGIDIGLEGRFVGNKITMGTELYMERDFFRDLTMQQANVRLDKIGIEGLFCGLQSSLDFQLKERKLANQLSTENVIASRTLWGTFNKQLVFRPAVVYASLDYWFDDGTEFEDNRGMTINTFQESGAQIFINSRLRRGILNGITVVTGIKANSDNQGTVELFTTIGLNYNTKGGVKIHARFTTPNFEEPSSYWEEAAPKRTRYLRNQFDRFGQRVSLDNIISISYGASF